MPLITKDRWHNLSTTAKQIVTVWACVVTVVYRRQWLNEEMNEVSFVQTGTVLGSQWPLVLASSLQGSMTWLLTLKPCVFFWDMWVWDCFGSINTHDLRWVLCWARADAIAVAPSSPIRLKLRSRTSRAVSHFNSSASWRAPSRVIRLLQEINSTQTLHDQSASSTRQHTLPVNH